MQAHLEGVCSAQGALIKRALGYGSGERKQIEATADCVREFSSDDFVNDDFGSARVDDETTRLRVHDVHDETFVLQGRVAIDEEYRVHTVEGRVAPKLTYRRYGWGISPDEREAPNTFVQRAIDRLPNGFVRGAIVAWDVAKIRVRERAGDDRFVIIEANLAGYHPVFDRGFQCSGFFQGPWGPALVARLFEFIEQTYGVKVRVDVDVPADAIEHHIHPAGPRAGTTCSGSPAASAR